MWEATRGESEMTDPNQKKTFRSKKNGKIYFHRNRHVANARQVDMDLFVNSFEERKERKITREEIQIFTTAYNMGYKEGTKRPNPLQKGEEET